MKNALTAVVVIVAIEHLWFLVLEMFLWTRPIGLKTFRNTPEFAKQSAALAGNQGLYNGFLVAGLLWGVFHSDRAVGLEITVFFLTCVVVAGVFGAVTVSRRILYIQAVPGLLGLGLAWLDLPPMGGGTGAPPIVTSLVARLAVVLGSAALWLAGLRLFLRSELSVRRKLAWSAFLLLVGSGVGFVLPPAQLWRDYLLLLALLPVLAVADRLLLRSRHGWSFWVRACGFEVCTVFAMAGAARCLFDLAGIRPFLERAG